MPMIVYIHTYIVYDHITNICVLKYLLNSKQHFKFNLQPTVPEQMWTLFYLKKSGHSLNRSYDKKKSSRILQER